MPEFFVWMTPRLIELIDAASDREAAEAVLGEPASHVPIPEKPPACFVQATNGLEGPRSDGSAVEFWRDEDRPPA